MPKKTMCDEFSDECPVCQALKGGKTSLNELKRAFQKAKDQGALVGGQWFEKEDEE